MRYSALSAFNARNRSIKSELSSIVSPQRLKIADQTPDRLSPAVRFDRALTLEFRRRQFVAQADDACEQRLASHRSALPEALIHIFIFDGGSDGHAFFHDQLRQTGAARRSVRTAPPY